MMNKLSVVTLLLQCFLLVTIDSAFISWLPLFCVSRCPSPSSGRAALSVITRLRLFIGELAFFNLLDQGQFKIKIVVFVYALSHRIHLFGGEDANHIQADAPIRRQPAAMPKR